MKDSIQKKNCKKYNIINLFMHYLINITRFITDEAAESIKHKYMYLLFDERVYLVTKVATSTHNPTSFFAITTFWEFINRIIKTLLAIIA